MSFHTYICSKYHKRIELSTPWVEEARARLTPELAAKIKEMKVDNEWKSAYLLAMLALPEASSPESFLAWLEQMSASDMAERFAGYSHPFPEDVEAFRSRLLTVFTGWNEQYFRFADPAIDAGLGTEARIRQEKLTGMKQEAFLDETTNGLIFKPISGMDKLLLIPQYHSQPYTILYHYDDTLLIHYNTRLYLGDEDVIPTPDLRILRSLGEKSRLKILRYLNAGPRTFIEISKHLKLSKGITHDHLFNLRSAGLITSYIEGENQVAFGIRRHALYRIQDKLFQYIEG
ncbi:ArsR family transcriptional regulator [Paenibacillus sp. NEAU-GSW1]|nr:ArsR family transcriptional regulator [Paenibacillus sp. NEAU-GSW1]